MFYGHRIDEFHVTKYGVAVQTGPGICPTLRAGVRLTQCKAITDRGACERVSRSAHGPKQTSHGRARLEIADIDRLLVSKRRERPYQGSLSKH
jgi:hypothetical protein